MHASVAWELCDIFTFLVLVGSLKLFCACSKNIMTFQWWKRGSLEKLYLIARCVASGMSKIDEHWQVSPH